MFNFENAKQAAGHCLYINNIHQQSNLIEEKKKKETNPVASWKMLGWFGALDSWNEKLLQILSHSAAGLAHEKWPNMLNIFRSFYVRIVEAKCITNNDNVNNDSFEYFKIEIVILPMTSMNCYRYIRSCNSFRLRHSTFSQCSVPSPHWLFENEVINLQRKVFFTLWVKSTDTTAVHDDECPKSKASTINDTNSKNANKKKCH